MMFEASKCPESVNLPSAVTDTSIPGMNAAVTAEGKLSDQGHFEANHIMAKCPSKYEMKELQAKGQRAPHAAVVPAAAQETKN